MRESDRLARVNATVRECLDLCYASGNPFQCWAVFVEKLRADRTWNRNDVEQVQIATRRILKAMVLPDSDVDGLDAEADWQERGQEV
jgi:hypothetical protein